MKDSYSDTRQIENAIRQLKALKENGGMPGMVADASIDALSKKLKSYRAQQVGDGAIAQGEGSLAIGKGGVKIDGSFNGNINTGDTEINIYAGLQNEDSRKAFETYCEYLEENIFNLSPLYGIFFDSSSPASNTDDHNLLNTYIDLDTTNLVEVVNEKNRDKYLNALQVQNRIKTPLGVHENIANKIPVTEKRVQSVLEACIAHRRMVLLGEPGSGKSTFINMLGYVLCRNRLKPDKGIIDRYLPGWPNKESMLLPILVVLREFVETLEIQEPATAKPSHLWNFIKAQLVSQNLEKLPDHLQRELEKGNCLLLLDGLDEVQTKKQRMIVGAAISEFLNNYNNNYALITCRSLSYQPDDRLKIKVKVEKRRDEFLPEVKIAPFNNTKIRKFVNAWYEELSSDRDLPKKEHLLRAVGRSDLNFLAQNPLLLTLMALVHTYRKKLPDSRALIYEEAVDILIWRWDQYTKGSDEGSVLLLRLLQIADHTKDDLKSVLCEFAYKLYERRNNGNTQSDPKDIRLHKLLEPIALRLDASDGVDLNWIQAIKDAIQERTGLLIEKDGIFEFLHHTFMEYLAGAYLASEINFPKHAIELLEKERSWGNVISLAAGRLAYIEGDGNKCISLVGALCLAKPDDPLVWEKASLAVDILLEIRVDIIKESVLFEELHEKIHRRLMDVVERDKLMIQKRVRAGNALSILGDTRFFDKERWFLPGKPNPLGFVRIPAGKFLKGSDPNKDSGTVNSDEQPKDDYYLACYPVTVDQYKMFVEMSGYDPGEKFSMQGTGNHPVVNVSWDDSLAYCKWLDQNLKAESRERIQNVQDQDQLAFWQGLADGRLHVTLPSESEWEMAAQGTDGRLYPWEGEFDSGKANVQDTGIGSTSAVGCFPNGASPYGILDMSGNVYEWTRSLGRTRHEPENVLKRVRGFFANTNLKNEGKRENEDDSNEIVRILRGGSFNSRPDAVRCTDRFSASPDSRQNDYGFRIVVSPLLPELTSHLEKS